MTITNEYYEFTPSFTPGAKVRAAEVNQQYQLLQNAFDFLPAANDALTTGTATFATESGSANAYVVTMPDPRSANADGDEIIFFATHANTGAATLNVDGLGAITLVDRSGVALSSNDIVSGRLYIATYDDTNTRFVLDVTTNVVTNIIDVVQGGLTNDPVGGGASTARLRFENAVGDLVSAAGHNTSATFLLENRIWDGALVIAATSSAGLTNSFYTILPDTTSTMRATTVYTLQVGIAGAPKTALVATANAGVAIRYNNIEECSTVDGAFEVTNFFQNRTETQTNLLDVGHAVNTSNGKILGAQVYDSTNGTPLWADGNAAGSTWSDAAGAVVHTPI